MLALRSSNRLTLADFNDSWLTGATRPEEPTMESGSPAEADVENVLGSAECDALRRTLEAFHWNISAAASRLHLSRRTLYRKMHRHGLARAVDRKSTRLNSSHSQISYAVFCLKKKKQR